MSTLKKNVTSALNRFTGLIVDHLKAAGGLDDEQTRGLRNVIRDAARLPSGKGNETMVTNEQIAAAFATVRTLLCIGTDDAPALIPFLSSVGSIEGTYSHTPVKNGPSVNETVTIDCSGFTVPDTATLDAWQESAMNGGNSALATLDW